MIKGSNNTGSKEKLIIKNSNSNIRKAWDKKQFSPAAVNQKSLALTSNFQEMGNSYL